MKNVCLSLMTTWVACAVALLPSQTSFAQSAPQPAVVVSFAPMEEQLNDMKYMVEASGFGNMNFLIQSQLKHFTSGIDSNRPSGVSLFFEGDDPQPKWLGMLAIENVDDLLDRIADFADVDEDGDMITIIPPTDEEIYAKEKNGYLFIVDDEKMFDRIPASPVDTLGDLPSQFNLAARVFGQRIPKALRQKAIELINEGYTRQMEELGEANDEFLDAQMEQIKSFVNDTEEMMIGFAADEEAGKFTSKVIFRSTPGSELAKRCNVMKDMSAGNFTGFVNPESAFDSNMTAKLVKEDIDGYKTLLDQVRSQILEEIDADGELNESEFEELENLADEVVAVLSETVESGVLAGGAVMMLEDGSMNFASGLKLADPKRLEASIRSLAEMAQQKAGDLVELKFESGSHDDIVFHTVNVTVPEFEEEAQNVLGDKVSIVIGIAGDAAYLGVGQDPVPLLISSIDKSKTPQELESLTQYNVYLTPILRFASKITSEAGLTQMVDVLEESGKDRISVFSDVIENGIESRIEMQDGILALIKTGAEAFQSGAFQSETDEF